jgi:triphosphoribosyl-dephospho-CoA synthetase
MDNNDTTVNVKDLLPKELLEAVSENGLATLQEAFDKLVESKVSEQIQTAVKSAEVSLDAVLTERMQKLVAKLDENAKINLVKVVNAINENHAVEMKNVKAQAMTRINEMRENANKAIANLKESYENKAAQEAEMFRESITKQLGKFITESIDKCIPYNEISAAVKNTKAIELLESFKQLLNFNETYQSESIKKPMMEAYNRIQNGKKEISNLAAKNEALEAELAKAKAIIAESERKAYLAKKLAEIPSKDQRMFVERVLEKASLQFIKDNFEYTCKQYRTNVLRENAVLAERTRANSKSQQIAEHSRKELSRMMTEGKKPAIEKSSKKPLNESKNSWLSKLVKDWKDNYED